MQKGKKICRICKKRKKIMSKDGPYFRCRDCNTKIVKQYRNTEKGRERTNQAVYASIKRHIEKQVARVIFNSYLKVNGISRPKRCPECKRMKKVEGHHDDYSKPLKAKWMCRQCHADLHRKLKKV